MKKVLAATAVVVFGLAPAIGAACDYSDDSSASATPPVLASTPAPAATKVPAAVAKTSTPNALKQVASKAKAPVPDQKVAVGTTNYLGDSSKKPAVGGLFVAW